MEEIFVRFPQLGKQILEQLDNKALIKTRVSCRSWTVFVDYEKIASFRGIKRYTNNSEKFLKKVLNKLSPEDCIEVTKEVRIAFEEFETRKWEPISPILAKKIIKCEGSITAIENIMTTYPLLSFGQTVLHFAAMKAR